MPTSEEELNAKREEIAKLRGQVESEEAKRIEREANAANDIEMTNLKVEEARLEARLISAKEANKVAAVKDGVDTPLAAAKESLAQALAQKKAVESPKDEGNQIPTSQPPPLPDGAAVAGPDENGGTR